MNWGCASACPHVGPHDWLKIGQSRSYHHGNHSPIFLHLEMPGCTMHPNRTCYNYIYVYILIPLPGAETSNSYDHSMWFIYRNHALCRKKVTVLLIVTTKISRSLGSSCQFPRRRTQHLRFSHQQWQCKGSLKNHGLNGLNSLEEWGDECRFYGGRAWSIEMDFLWVKY